MTKSMLLAALVLSAAATAGQAANYDGSYSVLLTTQRGACDKVYRFPVNVEGGKVFYAGQTGAVATGGVDAAGRVTATIQYGQDMLRANGRITPGYGEGRWTSPTRKCSGAWTADKR
ncbi:hypothetical protein ABEG18_04045 [Alsobacter sp. KACC 23698]|uniref:Uncharacterized protein n=1 Tax=Alsobacter sp. KACC 23698 TaxID=3149229 RepID=A0AAU7JII9_9HYPH